jgi:hypothetical protein
MIFAIVAAILAYRTAKESGRNGFLWAAVGAAVFVGSQSAVSFDAGILLGFGVEFLGWSETIYDETMVWGPITVVALGVSILATWLLLRYLGKPLREDTGDFSPPPPPPTTFGDNQ